jgi:hypothetical protein
MIDRGTFDRIVALLGAQGREDIAWAEQLGPPETADDFALETIYVICNSGMRYTVARGIYDRVVAALRAGRPAGSAFGHSGKAAAIDAIWRDRAALREAYLAAADKVAWCAELPWVGGITKYHVAKNFGADVAKPDVHLQRLADLNGCSVHELCAGLARETGYRVATVDTLLWRACATGVLNSVTGQLREAA